MRIPPSPTPAPQQAEVVARARRVLDDARRQGRTPAAIALAHAAYTLACREAGAVDPPPLAEWPGVTSHILPVDLAGCPINTEESR